MADEKNIENSVRSRKQGKPWWEEIPWSYISEVQTYSERGQWKEEKRASVEHFNKNAQNSNLQLA